MGVPHLQRGGLLEQDGGERLAGPALGQRQRASGDGASQEREKHPLTARVHARMQYMSA